MGPILLLTYIESKQEHHMNKYWRLKNIHEVVKVVENTMLFTTYWDFAIVDFMFPPTIKFQLGSWTKNNRIIINNSSTKWGQSP
jgi:hypothetical protein